MVSGLLSRHRPMVLSLVWQRACLCCVPLPHVTEHWRHKTWTVTHITHHRVDVDICSSQNAKKAKGLISDLLTCQTHQERLFNTLDITGKLFKKTPNLLNLIFHLPEFWLQFGLHTCDHGPTLHWVGQACRLQGLRVSGRLSLQCLLWMERVVLSYDGWTQLSDRICNPVFPHGLLQFCHSPVTQLDTTQRTDTKTSEDVQNFKML